MSDKPYNDLKLRSDQMVSPQEQATNAYKDNVRIAQTTSDQLNGIQTGGKKKKVKNTAKNTAKKYSNKNPVYNKIRNPETNRYVNVDSTMGRRILRNYLENYSNIKAK